FFQAEDGIRDDLVTGVQTCALPICAFGDRRTPGKTAGRAPPDSRRPTRAATPSVAWSSALFFALAAGPPPPPRAVADTSPRISRSEERRVGKECGARWWTRD